MTSFDGVVPKRGLGSRPDLEAAYVRAVTSVDPHDGALSLREALLQAHGEGATPEDAQKVVEAHHAVAAIRKQLLAAGYTYEDLLQLAARFSASSA